MSSASVRYLSMRAVEKFSLRDIITKSVSKFTARVWDLRRAVGSFLSKWEKRGSIAVIIDSPWALYLKRTKSPVTGVSVSAPISPRLTFRTAPLSATLSTRLAKALFFLRARISPAASLQTRW